MARIPMPDRNAENIRNWFEQWQPRWRRKSKWKFRWWFFAGVPLLVLLLLSIVWIIAKLAPGISSIFAIASSTPLIGLGLLGAGLIVLVGILRLFR